MLIARAQCCEEEVNANIETNYEINKVSSHSLKPVELEEINIGSVDKENTKLLLDTLNEYRDCFAQSLEELGTANTMRKLSFK